MTGHVRHLRRPTTTRSCQWRLLPAQFEVQSGSVQTRMYSISCAQLLLHTNCRRVLGRVTSGRCRGTETKSCKLRVRAGLVRWAGRSRGKPAYIYVYTQCFGFNSDAAECVLDGGQMYSMHPADRRPGSPAKTALVLLAWPPLFRGTHASSCPPFAAQTDELLWLSSLFFSLSNRKQTREPLF